MICVCVRMCERESERDTRQRMEILKMCILQNENDQHITKWEEGALYSHPLSSLTTRHMSHGECGSS